MNQNIDVINLIYKTSKAVQLVYPDAKVIATGFDGENSFIIYREKVKGVIGALVGKGATQLEAWLNARKIIASHGADWYYDRRNVVLGNLS